MPRARWHAAADGRFWLEVMIANRRIKAMVDLGLIDPRQFVGLEVDPVLYDSLKGSGQMTMFRFRNWRSASGQRTLVESGVVQAQLIDPTPGTGIGPKVQIYASRGFAGIPNRLGSAFFHALKGCLITWELDRRDWCIDCP